MRSRRRNQFNKRNSQYVALGALLGMLIAALAGFSINAVALKGETSSSQTVRGNYFNKG